MEPLELLAGCKAVGAKETLKAIEKDQAHTVFIAKNAESRVVDPVRCLCTDKGIKVVEVETMEELGSVCRLSVNAACAAALK